MLQFTFAGFEIQKVVRSENRLTITAQTLTLSSVCPTCQHVSSHIHSYYTRHPHDLPISGQTVQLVLQVRRFRCQNKQCPRKTFAERLPELPVSARQTGRLGTILESISIVLSGQAGSRLTRQLAMPVSADTLLRRAKRSAATRPTPRILGVDDFSFRRGLTYGTILIDLESHQPVDLLPERTAEALASWLSAHPGVQWISRDRATEYARGAKDGAPNAQQIVDRWHLLKNWREVLERVLGRVYANLKQRQINSGVTIRSRYRKSRSSSDVAASQVSRERRLARYTAVVHLAHQGKSITAIAAQLHLSPTTVTKFVNAGAFPERVTRPRSAGHLGPYHSYLRQRVEEGCENATELWKEVRQQGFTGGYKMVNIWIREYRQKPGRHSSVREKTRRESFHLPKLAGNAGEMQLDKTKVAFLEGENNSQILLEDPLPAPRHLAWLLLRNAEQLDEQEEQLLAFLRQERAIQQVYPLAQQFVAMVQHRQGIYFDNWLLACKTSDIPDVQTFAEGLQREYTAVKAALTHPYSNGPVEGNITKLKYIKRSLYGRGSFALLRSKVLKAA